MLDYSRGSIPDDVVGLDNWRQRTVLYNHIQTIERSTWNVNHNLGTYPSVSVFVNRPTTTDPSNQEEITPTDIITVDSNNLKLVFDRAWSGIAQVVARQSDPNILQPVTTTTSTIATTQQISNLGEITLATRVATVGEPSIVDVKLTFDSTQGTTNILTYAADNQPSTNSAWSDTNKVIIKGKIYTIRSFNGITSEMTAGTIGNGSTFRFSQIDKNDGAGFVDIQSEEVLILLSSSPFGPYDKITTEYVDVSNITSVLNPFALFYDTGEFFASVDVINNTYPPIRSI